MMGIPIVVDNKFRMPPLKFNGGLTEAGLASLVKQAAV